MTVVNATRVSKYPDGFTFDARQTSTMLGISRSQLKRLVERGVIAPAITRGKDRTSSLYNPEDVDKLIALGGVHHLVQHRRKDIGDEGGNKNGRLIRIENLLVQILDRLDGFKLVPPPTNGK